MLVSRSLLTSNIRDWHLLKCFNFLYDLVGKLKFSVWSCRQRARTVSWEICLRRGLVTSQRRRAEPVSGLRPHWTIPACVTFGLCLALCCGSWSCCSMNRSGRSWWTLPWGSVDSPSKSAGLHWVLSSVDISELIFKMFEYLRIVKMCGETNCKD